MGSIKQICERSKWFHGPQSLLPALKILAFNDWMRPRDRNEAVKPANQMEPISHDTFLLTPVTPGTEGVTSSDLTSASVAHRQIKDKQVLLDAALIVLLISFGVTTCSGKVVTVIEIFGFSLSRFCWHDNPHVESLLISAL
ncbi:hypothetical protein ABVT39_012546 [Epinephelus coioides]